MAVIRSAMQCDCYSRRLARFEFTQSLHLAKADQACEEHNALSTVHDLFVWMLHMYTPRLSFFTVQQETAHT